MRHRKAKSLLNRFTSWRKATLISLAKSLLISQQITTTKIKAKSVRPLVENLISLAKQNTLTAKRRAFKILGDHRLVNLLFSDIGPRFIQRVGGYTRILNLGQRRGDGAALVLLELTEIKKKETKKPKKQKETQLQPEEEKKPATAQEDKPTEEKKTKTEVAVKEEKPPLTKKPSKKFLGGLRNIFKNKKERGPL
jgi:large subunit ribosomal protein L17